MNYGWPVNAEREREKSVLCRSFLPPGLWKCHAVSVAMQMVTLECCKRGKRKELKAERERDGAKRKRRRRAAGCFLSYFFN